MGAGEDGDSGSSNSVGDHAVDATLAQFRNERGLAVGPGASPFGSNSGFGAGMDLRSVGATKGRGAKAKIEQALLGDLRRQVACGHARLFTKHELQATGRRLGLEGSAYELAIAGLNNQNALLLKGNGSYEVAQ